MELEEPMSDDLIERLREQARHYKVPIMASHSLEVEAADEIERLADENFNLRSAMRAQLQPLADIATTIEQATR